MGRAVELGRSFIRAEYQKGFAPLLLLWKGIGKFIAANPQYKTLFGPVSISNQYQSISRELMIGFLEKHASLTQWLHLVRSRHEPRTSPSSSRCSNVQELAQIIGDLEPGQPGIPVLLRQYLKLGGKLLGFNVDPEFSNSLDGLIVVDLTKTEPKLL
jgi:putative hemolysin